MENKIEVIINISDFPFEQSTPEHYVAFVHGKLVDAGIPIDSDGNLEKGRIKRLDDPEDFGLTRWVWEDICGK